MRHSDWTDPQPLRMPCVVNGGPGESQGLGGRDDRAEDCTVIQMYLHYSYFSSLPTFNHYLVSKDIAPFVIFQLAQQQPKEPCCERGGEDISQRMKSIMVFRLVDAVPATLPLLA